MENSKKADATAKQAGFSIVARIAAILKLDDAGRLDKFFTREVKKLEREIASIENNIKTIKMQHELDAIEATETIEDAQQAVDDAYLNVVVDDIKTNASSDEFADLYWFDIDDAEHKLKLLLKAQKEASDKLAEEVKDLNKEVAACLARINKIK